MYQSPGSGLGGAKKTKAEVSKKVKKPITGSADKQYGPDELERLRKKQRSETQRAKDESSKRRAAERRNTAALAASKVHAAAKKKVVSEVPAAHSLHNEVD